MDTLPSGIVITRTDIHEAGRDKQINTVEMHIKPRLWTNYTALPSRKNISINHVIAHLKGIAGKQ